MDIRKRHSMAVARGSFSHSSYASQTWCLAPLFGRKSDPRCRFARLAVKEEMNVSRGGRIVGIAVAPDNAKIVFLVIEDGLHLIV